LNDSDLVLNHCQLLFTLSSHDSTRGRALQHLDKLGPVLRELEVELPELGSSLVIDNLSDRLGFSYGVVAAARV